MKESETNSNQVDQEKIIKNLKIAQGWGERYLPLLLAGMEVRTSMHPNPQDFYNQDIVEFSNLFNPKEESNSWNYLKGRFNYTENEPSIDIAILFSVCQEIKSFGYPHIVTNSLIERLEYVGLEMAIREYLEKLEKLVKAKKNGVSIHEDDAVILIKLKENYNFKRYVKKLWENLVDKEYVYGDQEDFLGLFSFNKKGNSKPMTWKKSQAALYFFLFRLLEDYSDTTTIKVFSRVANEWFKPEQDGNKKAFENPMVYHSNLKLYSRLGSNSKIKRSLPSKNDELTLNGILDRSFS